MCWYFSLGVLFFNGIDQFSISAASRECGAYLGRRKSVSGAVSWQCGAHGWQGKTWCAMFVFAFTILGELYLIHSWRFVQYEALAWTSAGLGLFAAIAGLAAWSDKASRIPFVRPFPFPQSIDALQIWFPMHGKVLIVCGTYCFGADATGVSVWWLASGAWQSRPIV